MPSAVIIDTVRRICMSLPEVGEMDSWVHTPRWYIRTESFAHVVDIADGWPAAYAKAAGTDGPVTVLTFLASGDELDALTNAGPLFFRPPWRRGLVGMFVDDDTDWDEVRELVTESYCVVAPKKLAVQVRG
jgi:hypothetical protein